MGPGGPCATPPPSAGAAERGVPADGVLGTAELSVRAGGDTGPAAPVQPLRFGPKANAARAMAAERVNA